MKHVVNDNKCFISGNFNYRIAKFGNNFEDKMDIENNVSWLIDLEIKLRSDSY